LPREGCYFFFDEKVAKKSSQQKGFFAARALRCKSGKTWAGKSCAALCAMAYAPARSLPFCKYSLCPAAAHGLHSFAGFRPKLFC
jgi:hypothetical protein